VIPSFNESGQLPPGIHQASFDEFQERFAIFDRSDRRLQVYAQLERLLIEVKKAAVVKRVYVGGSFVTAKAEPNDFDRILVLDPSVIGTTLRPFEYNLVSRKMARRLFGGDVLPALEGSEALSNYLEFFRTSRSGGGMGIMEVVL